MKVFPSLRSLGAQFSPVGQLYMAAAKKFNSHYCTWLQTRSVPRGVGCREGSYVRGTIVVDVLAVCGGGGGREREGAFVEFWPGSTSLGRPG